VQQRSAIIQKPLRRQADKTWHRQTSIPSQLHKLQTLLRRNTNLNACIIHSRNLRTYKHWRQRTTIPIYVMSPDNQT